MSEPCPHPDKKRFGDEQSAKDRIRFSERRGQIMKRKAYRCRCGFWHIANADSQRRRRQRERRR